MFGQAAEKWRVTHPNDEGNMRDEADAAQLVCLSNLENLNALFIAEGLSQSERLRRLNKIAIHQMTLLSEGSGRIAPKDDKPKSLLGKK